MKINTHSERILILVFLATIFSVPAIQTVIEVRRGERPQALEVFDRQPSSANLRAYENALEDASFVAKRLRPWAQFAQFEWLGDGGEKAMLGRQGWLFYKPGVLATTERDRAIAGHSTVNQALAAIIRLRDDLRSMGIQLLVVPAPNKESLYPEQLPVGSRRPTILRSAGLNALINGLKSNGVEVLDLLEVFRNAKAEQPRAEPLYLAQDSHWSPAGVGVAAEAVAKRLLAKLWVAPGKIEYETKPIAIRRAGDVLRMLQVPALENRIPPEPVNCNQVVSCGDREPYRDDPNSEILVMGDSFLRIYETDGPGSAGFISQLARELRRPLASLVNDGGASTLVRQELARRPSLLKGKKVVIYEFVERDIRLGTEGWQKVSLANVAAPR